MDIGSAISFAESATGSGLIAAFLLLVGYKYLFPDVRENSRRWAKAGGFIFALICAASLLGIPLFATTSAPAAQSVGTYTVTASDSLSYVSEDNVAHTITVAMAFDYTNNTFTGGTSSVVVQFDIERGLGTTGFVQTYVDVSSVPTVTGSNGIAHPMVAQVTNQYQATWNYTNSAAHGSANKMMTVNLADTQNGQIVTLTATLDTGAAHVMQKYASENIGLTIAGQSWTVVCLMASTTGDAGWTGA